MKGSLKKMNNLNEAMKKLQESKINEVVESKKYYGINCSDDEMYSSTSNTIAFELLQSIAQYFKDYTNVVDNDPMLYQGEKVDKLEDISQRLNVLVNDLEEYWSNM